MEEGQTKTCAYFSRNQFEIKSMCENMFKDSDFQGGRRGEQKLKDENTYANHRKLMQKQQGHFRIDLSG